MSAIEYRNLLYEISQEVDWLSESQRLLFICEGFIREGSEYRIHDVLSLFKELQEQKNLGIDYLQLPKEIVKGIGKWNLLERIKKFEIKREEFRTLLETVSRVLDESGHLERLVAICKGRIAEERESRIENTRALLTELENNNALAVGQVGILKTLVGEDRPDLLQQVEEFERKREQEETTERKIKESEDAKRRRKAQAVAVLSSAKYAGERLIGTVTPYCTFRNVAGVTVIVTTWMILRRSTNLEEFVTSFTEAVLPAANTLRAISEGSICFTIQAENSSALEALWKRYQDGVLRDKLQEFLVTDEIKQLAGGEEVTLEVHIDEQDYHNGCFDLMTTETRALKVKENVPDKQRSRRNSDSVVYTTARENDVPAVLPQTKETRLKFHQVKVKQLEEKLWKLKEKLEETNKLAMETNQTVAKISGYANLDKGTPKQRMEMEPIRHMAREFDEDRAFEVKQWEKSTFMWKIDRFFYDQPQMFLEPSGISDSGAFSQSTFSELQSEEDKESVMSVGSEMRDEGLEGEVKSRRRKEEQAAKAEKLGIQLKFNSGDYLQAIECLQKALTIRQEIRDRKGEVSARVNLGYVYSLSGDYVIARKYIDSALEITKEIGDKQGEAKAYEKLGILHDFLGDYQRAVEYHKRALRLSQETGNKQGEAAANGNLGNAYNSLCDYQKAVEYHERALRLNQETGNKEGEAAAYGNLGNAYYFLDDYQRAVGYHERGLKLNRETGNKQGEAVSYRNLGYAYHSLGDYQKAVEYHERELRLNQETGNKQEKAAAYVNLGYAYHSLGDYQRAVEYHERALRLNQETGNKQGEAAAYVNLGIAYHFLGDYQRAVEYHERGLKLNQETGNKQWEALSYRNLGTAYHSFGDYERAVEYHERGLKLNQETGNKQGEAAAYVNLGKEYHSLGDYQRAVEYLERALRLNQETENKRGEALVYGDLGLTYHALGHYQRAVEYHERALKFGKETGNKRVKALAYENLGTSYINLGDYQRAEDYLERARKIRKETET